MDAARIEELLGPYLGEEKLSSEALERLRLYLELLLRWNGRMNLTAVRDPESIVTRHFGESLFTARILFADAGAKGTLVDVGSGAGFPGLPIAILRPGLAVTLLEAHGKKATFLKEAIRTTGTANAQVGVERAERFSGNADVVTLRAVEDFSSILPISARIVAGSGRLAALVGVAQVAEGKRLLGEFWTFAEPVYFPDSSHRALWIAQRSQSGTKVASLDVPRGTI